MSENSNTSSDSGSGEEVEFSVGTRVYDRDEGPAAGLIIVDRPAESCEERTVPGTGKTVADFNDEYPADAEVCVAVFISNLYISVPEWETKDTDELLSAIDEAEIKTYSYPKPRLRRYEQADSSRIAGSIRTYYELICYQYARLIQLAADTEDTGFLWSKYYQLLDDDIEMASITKENQYQLQEDFGVCTYCGKEAETQYDHIIPISQGGPADISNQVPACPACNSEKNDADVIDWHHERGKPIPRIVWGKYLKLYKEQLEANNKLHDEFPESERTRWDGIEITRNITKRIRTSHLKRDEAGRNSTTNESDNTSDETPSREKQGQTELGDWG